MDLHEIPQSGCCVNGEIGELDIHFIETLLWICVIGCVTRLTDASVMRADTCLD